VDTDPTTLNFSLPVSTMGDLSLTVRQAQLRFNVSGGSGTKGILGGELNTEELIMAASAFLPESTLRTVFENAADLDPIMGDSGDWECRALSVGLTYEVVDAVRGDVQ
jgi:hypothetical protein